MKKIIFRALSLSLATLLNLPLIASASNYLSTLPNPSLKTPVNSATKTTPAAVKPKPVLVKPHPATRRYMSAPNPQQFTTVQSTLGNYSLAMPNSFGSNPLADLPGLADAMIIRLQDNTLMAAANFTDHADAVHYHPLQELPDYPNKKVLGTWQQASANLVWDCTLSKVEDFHGNRYVLQAATKKAGLPYELLYVFPLTGFYQYLPQALYSLNSFTC